MIGAFILLLSLGAMLEFFVSYCRSQLAASARIPLSAHISEITRVHDNEIAANEFPALVHLSRLCPGGNSRGNDVAAVRVYYRLLNSLSVIAGAVAPGVRGWMEQERKNCAHFAAVILDRQIAHNLQMIAEQVSPSL